MEQTRLSTIAAVLLASSLLLGAANAQDTGTRPKTKAKSASKQGNGKAASRDSLSDIKSPDFLLAFDEETIAEIQRRCNESYDQACDNGLSPEQIATINQLHIEITAKKSLSGINYTSSLKSVDLLPLGQNYENFPHPILVGRNVVFEKEWADYFSGPGSKITPQQFAQLRDNLDKTYDSYVDLTGTTPYHGEKVLVCLSSSSVEECGPGIGPWAGHAHGDRNIICLNKLSDRGMDEFWDEVRKGSWGRTLMHELAHTFTNNRGWDAGFRCDESMAELMISYALEHNKGATLGSGNDLYTPHVAGNQHRMLHCRAAYENFISGDIKTFSRQGREGTVHAFYLQGLVEKVGWEPYRKAFRSYQDESYESEHIFKGASSGRFVLRFLERVARNCDNPDAVLKSLPDNGSLLETFGVGIVSKKELEAEQEAELEAEIDRIKKIEKEAAKRRKKIETLLKAAEKKPEKAEALRAKAHKMLEEEKAKIDKMFEKEETDEAPPEEIVGPPPEKKGGGSNLLERSGGSLSGIVFSL